MMRDTISASKRAEQAYHARKVQDYLAAGGQKTVLTPRTHSDGPVGPRNSYQKDLDNNRQALNKRQRRHVPENRRSQQILRYLKSSASGSEIAEHMGQTLSELASVLSYLRRTGHLAKEGHGKTAIWYRRG